jgi:hypothetical protein
MRQREAVIRIDFYPTRMPAAKFATEPRKLILVCTARRRWCDNRTVLGGKGSRSRAKPKRALASCPPFCPSINHDGRLRPESVPNPELSDDENEENVMDIHVAGIDLGKTLFHLVGLDAAGKVVIRKRCSRAQLLSFTANVRTRRIGMEASSAR